MKSNSSGDTVPAFLVIISCVIIASTVFIVSLIIKILLRTWQERLTFVNRLDDVKYHLTSLCMEIVEITEQYCYSMNIAIIPTLNLPWKIAIVILFKSILNYLTKRTTNSCSYQVFRSNIVFVVYHISPVATSVIIQLCEAIQEHRRVKKGSFRLNGNAYGCGTSKIRRVIRQDLNQGVFVLRSIMALIVSSYISNRCILALWSGNMFNTKTAFFKTRCTRNLKVNSTQRADTLYSATREAVIAFMYLALQVGLRNTCKCLGVSKNLLTSSILMYINMTAFRYTGVLMNPTYATALMYGCPGEINKEHFYIFWIGPIVGALVFKDVVKATQTLCTWSGYCFRRVSSVLSL